MLTKVHFIAGAICSHCGHQDTVKRILLKNKFTIECVDCGHRQIESPQAPSKNVLSFTEPQTTHTEENN
ncbi:MAG TPA: DNA-binding protein [Gammaproteobacteria bacterium]|nr:DNA-binding protein [Gammaproteobacteria bacterium]